MTPIELSNGIARLLALPRDPTIRIIFSAIKSSQQICVVCPTTCDMKKLLDALVGANYSSHMRPVQHENETITVDLQMELYIIREMTAKLQILHANAWIQVSWLDLFLQWDPAAYGGIKVVTIPSELIWRPDIILFNDVDQERTAVEVFGHTMATVKFNGHIYWSMPVLFKSSCKFHPANYPFDVQVCPLTFGSWNHNSKEVNVTSSHKVKTYAGGRISENGEWELIGVKTRTVARAKRQRGGDFPFLIFDLTLMRKPLFYVFHLLVPAVMLMVISVLVFLVPTESKQKIVKHK
ncbi:Neuronal acetylcholine receptor subunit alpha-9-I [Lamellibrachia satsuma]|nr:Neuronal acetylcholine receptor subunit alpha-9-I [Lamellibrachia satsuma]